MTTKTTRVWAVAALVTMVTGFSACLKTDNVTPQRDRAAVAVINGILGSADLDFYDNSTKVSPNPLSIGFATRGYLIFGGIHTFTYKKTGTTTDFATTTDRYDSLNYYTVVSYGDSLDTEMISIKDDFSAAKDAAVNIRFFHLSPTTGPVDVYLDNQKVDSNRTYVGNSGFRTAFVPLTKSIYTNNIKIKLAGTDSVLAENSSPDASFASGKVYTITLIGSKAYTDKRKLAVNSVYSLY